MQSLTILTLAHAAMRCHELVADPNTPAATRRAAQLVCRRLERIASNGDRASRSLDRLARRLDGVDAQTLRRAASGLRQLSPIG